MYLYRIGVDWDWKLGIIKFRYEFIKNIEKFERFWIL